jgi:hypothetical protein
MMLGSHAGTCACRAPHPCLRAAPGHRHPLCNLKALKHRRPGRQLLVREQLLLCCACT